MHGLHLGSNDHNDRSKPNTSGREFLGWIRHQYFLLLSQLAAFASVVYFFVSFFYYFSNSAYNQYLEPVYVQKIVFRTNIVVVAMFIVALLWVIGQNHKSRKRARKTYKKVFGVKIDPDDEVWAEKRLRKFKLWFLGFWVVMGLLYMSFLLQEYSKPHATLGKGELLQQLNAINNKPAGGGGKKGHVQDSNDHGDDDVSLLKVINDLKFSITHSHEIRALNREYDIFKEIQALETVNSHQADIFEFKTSLEEIVRLVKVLKTKAQTVKRTIPKDNEEIFNRVVMASSSDDPETKKQYIREAQSFIRGIPDVKSGSDEEKIFQAINGLKIGPSFVDTKVLREKIGAVSKKIKASDLIDTTPKGSLINETIIRAEKEKDLAEKGKIVGELTSLVASDSHYDEVWWKIHYAWLTFSLNTLGSWLIFVCFLYTAALSKGKDSERKVILAENRKFNFSAGFLVVLIGAFLLVVRIQLNGGSTYSELTSSIVFFDGLSGILNCVVLAMLIARLDSKLIGLPSYLIGVLYFYAAFQPLFVVFEQPGEIPQLIKTIVLVAVLVAKIYFFLIILFAAQTGRLLTYLYCFPTLSKRIDTIWTNSFVIEAEQTKVGFDFHIRAHGDDVLVGHSTADSVASFRKEIEKLRKVALDDANYVKDSSMENEVTISLMDEMGNVLCTSVEASMSNARAGHVIEECTAFIPDSDVKIRNVHGVIRRIVVTDPITATDKGAEQRDDPPQRFRKF